MSTGAYDYEELPMMKTEKKSNFRGTVYGFLFYLFVGLIAIFWLFVANTFLPENEDGNRLISTMMETGVVSWWGGVFLSLEGLLAYYAGRICAQYSAGDGSQKPFILSLLLLIPAIVLGAAFIGSDKIFEVAIICIIATMACTSGHNNYIDT